MPSSLFALTFTFAGLSCVRYAIQSRISTPNVYVEAPYGEYGINWQSHFQVPSQLPGLSFDIGTSYAGNLEVQRKDHPDNTLFFWGFESQQGSLTAAAGDRSTQPWAVWLQGGPGTSSLYGLFSENGPILLAPGTKTFRKNDQAWNQLIDYFWIDQPIGVGFSTNDTHGYAKDMDQVADDFVGFLGNLVKVFPSLATRPFFLTGESYAGRYIPYIAKALFSMSNPPVSLSKIVLGNPALGSDYEFKTLPTLSLIKTYPQIIGYDTDVYDYFAERQVAHLCGLDLNLTYPQTGGNFPPIELVSDEVKHSAQREQSNSFVAEVAVRHAARLVDAVEYDQNCKKFKYNQRVFDTGNTIIAQYNCHVWDEMVDYAVNCTFPWTLSGKFNSLDAPNAVEPNPSTNPIFFLNSAPIRSALHAPVNKNWSVSTEYHISGSEPMTFLTELATNATNHGVHIIIYVGNDDATSPHFGTEVTIQNTTFGGIQGFTKRPSTPWWDDNGNWSGIVHQERNWTYALIYGAGHEVPTYQPVAAYTFMREFVLGSNQTGLVKKVGNQTIVVGGENPTLQQDAIPGKLGIVYGSKTAENTTIWPSVTRAAFVSHVGQVKVTGTDPIAPSPTMTGKGYAN